MSRDEVVRHYRSPGLVARIEAGLAALGKRPPDIGLDDLAPVDEFHVRGPLATAELVGLLAARPGQRVLDAGAGLGGPARRLAQASGCDVVGVDLSEDYCAAGAALNAWTGLADRVELVVGDATDLGGFAAASFDAAWTIHAAMNIANKPGFYGEIARTVKPGGRFVAYDILRAGGGELDLPVPWASDAAASFLSSADELRGHLDAAGFGEVALQDRTAECRAFLEPAVQRPAGPPPPLGLHLVLGPAFGQMIGALARNFAAGRVAAAVVTCRRL